MNIKEVFINPTVKQVVFQIHYPNLFYIENKIGDIQLRIMKEFPESSLIFRQKLFFKDIGQNIEIKKDPDNLQEDIALKIWQFESPKNYRLNITSDSLDISSLIHKTYDNPQSDNRFRDIIDFVLKNFFETTSIPIIKRIGLRYIDECPIPEKTNKKFREYYQTTFPLSRFNIEDASEMTFNTVTKKGKHFLRFVESLKKINNEYKLILDFDGFSENTNPHNCLTVTDDLHRLISAEYGKSLKDPVYDFMRKEPSKKK
jgi:uncharacterized protein (TIGR04255 family)